MNDIDNKEALKILNGEWVIKQTLTDSVLILINNKNYKQDVFPTYNYIRFNETDSTIIVKTIGEFGCGTAATQNLKLYDTKWTLPNGKLQLKGQFSDYSGQHKLENFYNIEKKGETLLLTRIK